MGLNLNDEEMSDDEKARRHEDLIHWLETKIWPKTAGKTISKEEIEDLMGYDEMVEGRRSPPPPPQ